ncbi:uncharacterized protein LOC142628809 [Castanea sativa]|uniref:uncharacterized protein LOC142628809 n=1 Tax=Castanea sativa TaxID=21020 RepID=UPI003F64A78C
MASKAVIQELSKVEKLNGANHSVWKFHIYHVLFQDKVKYVIDISTPTPPPENANCGAKRMYEKHLEDDKTTRNILLTFMEPDIEILFKEYTHAKTMFDAIIEAYIQILIERFNGTMMNESDNVIEHVNKMIVIAKELAILGNPIPNKMQVSTILHSLPNSWDSAVMMGNAHQLMYSSLEEELFPEYASSKEMAVNPLTKAIVAESFKGHVYTMGVSE